MLWDRMRFNLDDFALEQALTGAFANAFLKTFNQGSDFLAWSLCPRRRGRI